jgi:hypothetical protein
MVLDESGSMGRSWQSVSATCSKFVEPFKDDDKTLFSVVLFDHGARILEKRVKAKDLQPLP